TREQLGQTSGQDRRQLSLASRLTEYDPECMTAAPMSSRVAMETRVGWREAARTADLDITPERVHLKLARGPPDVHRGGAGIARASLRQSLPGHSPSPGRKASFVGGYLRFTSALTESTMAGR